MKNKQQAKILELPKLMSKKQLAAFFDCSTKTVERKMADGLRWEKIDGKIYSREEWVIEYMNKKSKSA